MSLIDGVGILGSKFIEDSMQERRKLSVWHLQLQVKMLRKTPARQKWRTFIRILTQEQFAGCQISGELSETPIGYSMGLHVRIMHLGMQVFHICNYGANLRGSAVSWAPVGVPDFVLLLWKSRFLRSGWGIHPRFLPMRARHSPGTTKIKSLDQPLLILLQSHRDLIWQSNFFLSTSVSQWSSLLPDETLNYVILKSDRKCYL